MEIERRLMIATLRAPENSIIINSNVWRISKNPEFAEDARLQGNRLFEQKYHDSQVHEEIWQKYSLSIAVAAPGSEQQALAYGNRSALLFHLSKFKECIQDTDRAINITNSSALKTKLLCRKVKCLVLIGSSEVKNTLEKAKFWLSKSDPENMSKQSLLHLVKDTEIYFDKYRKEEEKIEQQKISKLKQNVDDFSSVVIKNDTKYGNHLIAACDIKPGEVIFIEKPYVCSLNPARTHAYCSHCFVISWAMIPCDLCSWCMFCSEECKNEAWEQYHDLECSAFACTQKMDQDNFFIQTSLRALIIGVREVGSIKKLRADLQNVDKVKSEGKEKALMIFMKNGKFENNGFRSLYSLCSDIKSSRILKMNSLRAFCILLSLAKYTKFFGKQLSSYECNHLVDNEDVLFIGSLILKLINISILNGQRINNRSIYSQNKGWSMESLYSNKGVCIATFSSLINVSCNPNASRCYTKDNKIVIYALQPIKKNTQIFECYTNSFYELPKPLRCLSLEQYGFTCNCEACKEDWPVLMVSTGFMTSLGKPPLKFIAQTSRKPLEMVLYNNNKAVIDLAESDENATYTQKMILDLAKSIEIATKNLKQPSVITCQLILTLKRVFGRLYGDYLSIPDTC